MRKKGCVKTKKLRFMRIWEEAESRVFLHFDFRIAK